MIDHSAIEPAKQRVLPTTIERRLSIGLPAICDKINVRRCQKVQAVAKFDYGTDDIRLIDWSQVLVVPPQLNLLREFKSARGIGFPKINSVAQPIPIICTGVEGNPCQQLFSYGAIASVVAKDERACETMQLFLGHFVGCIRVRDLPILGQIA